jgi:hypothetical protein
MARNICRKGNIDGLVETRLSRRQWLSRRSVAWAGVMPLGVLMSQRKSLEPEEEEEVAHHVSQRDGSWTGWLANTDRRSGRESRRTVRAGISVVEQDDVSASS